MDFSINIDLNSKKKFYKGDNLTIEINVNESIADWEIRAEIYDIGGSSYKLATANVEGGSISQISIEDEDTGEFTLNFPSGSTTNFGNDIFLEIERIDSSDDKKTIFKSRLPLNDEKIKWTERT